MVKLSLRLRIRIGLTATFAYLSARCAPAEIRAMVEATHILLRDAKHEIASGREGGIMMVAWGRTADGLALGNEQVRHCSATAAKVRDDWYS